MEAKRKFKLTTKRGFVMHTEAVNEDKARASFLRKRNKYTDSYASIHNGTIEDLGLTDKSKTIAGAKGLIDLLKKETESLKDQYLKFTEDWATKRFNNYVEMSNWTWDKWYDKYGITYLKKDNGSLEISVDSYNGKSLYKMRDFRSNVFKIVKNGVDAFTNKELKKANDHYETSIEKLAYRIAKKDLDQDNLKLETSHIGVNIETVITDGKKTVRAWTIIASGAIQRPHYRYLVK